ncbi:MAG TPA: metal-dependent hydrolase [Candidatus Woesearchaeota archaeon]|nr:metal-dependent hydrolase [Candidatus Woesearchaeota archaeon]
MTYDKNMMGRNHILVNLSAAILLDLSLANTVALILSATFPDKVDFYLYLQHRRYSHWWPLYAAGLFLSYYLFGYTDQRVFCWIGFFCTGCLLHILADFFTPAGIPGISVKYQHRIALFKTNSLTEYLIAVCVFTVSFWFKGITWLNHLVQ